MWSDSHRIIVCHDVVNFQRRMMKPMKWLMFVVFAVLLSCDDDPDTSTDCVDPSKITNGPCPEVLIPVCGCNGTTYGNSCEAEAAGVQSWIPGKCE